MTKRRWLMMSCLATAAALLAGCGEGVAGSQREPRSPSGIRDNTQLAGGADTAGRSADAAAPPPLPLIRDVALQRGFAYVLVPDALVVVALNDPAQPSVAGRLVLAKTPLRMAIAGGHAWIACDAGGLQVVSLSEPRNPQLVGAWAPESGGVTRVAVNEKRAVVAVPGRGVSLLDIADPAKPVEQKSIAINKPIADVALQGERAYALTDRVLLYDVSKPTAAEQVGEYPLKEALTAAAPVAEQTVLLTDQGLHLLNFRAPARPLPVSDLTFAAISEALSPTADEPTPQPAVDTTPAPEAATADDGRPVMAAADEVDLSVSPELAALRLGQGGEHNPETIQKSAAGETDQAATDEPAVSQDTSPKPAAEARLRVAGGLLLVVADGQVTLLEVREQKSIAALWRADDVVTPTAADRLADLLVIAQHDGLLRLYQSAEAGWKPHGSLKLNDQVSTESLPGTEPLPVSEAAKNAMQATPKPSSDRPAGTPGPA